MCEQSCEGLGSSPRSPLTYIVRAYVCVCECLRPCVCVCVRVRTNELSGHLSESSPKSNAPTRRPAKKTVSARLRCHAASHTRSHCNNQSRTEVFSCLLRPKGLRKLPVCVKISGSVSKFWDSLGKNQSEKTDDFGAVRSEKGCQFVEKVTSHSERVPVQSHNSFLDQIS